MPIANGQTISQPYIVAAMTELAELKATDRVLEVGTGSGYAAERVQNLEMLASSIRSPASTTGDSSLARAELSRAQRHFRPLSFLVIDIDFFKRVNDTFGHELGDWVLKMAATTIKDSKRDADVVARIGGEEFAVMLPETTRESAKSVAERIREMVQDNSLSVGKDRLRLTISVGVSQATVKSSGIESVLREADQELYQAKQAGRNQVCVAKRPVKTMPTAAE